MKSNENPADEQDYYVKTDGAYCQRCLDKIAEGCIIVDNGGGFCPQCSKAITLDGREIDSVKKHKCDEEIKK